MPTIHDTLILDHLTVGPFTTNVYVLGCARTKRGVIIDAGGDAPGLLAMADRHGITIEAIWQTHAHIDHIGAIHEVHEALPEAPILLHEQDLPFYEGAGQQAMMFGLAPLPALPAVDRLLEPGEVLECGDLRAEVLWFPGHSPGSVAFYFESQGTMIVGDVLFRGSIGRVDLPGSNPAQMKKSLSKLVTYPDETVIWNGHGPHTTLGVEKKTNPFLTQNW